MVTLTSIGEISSPAAVLRETFEVQWERGIDWQSFSNFILPIISTCKLHMFSSVHMLTNPFFLQKLLNASRHHAEVSYIHFDYHANVRGGRPDALVRDLQDKISTRLFEFGFFHCTQEGGILR